MQRRHLLATMAAMPLASAYRPGSAQTAFPNKAITIIVPATPGGAIDMAARLVGNKLTGAWGQPVTVDNKGGAAGIIGTDAVARAAPDGYTLALVASSHAINPSVYKKLPFDTIKSFEPVSQTHTVPLVLVVNNEIPARNVAELIQYLKANPGKVSFASSGTGGAPHMSAELFKTMAGVDIGHVPYKGSTAAHPDLIAGRVGLMFDTVSAVAPQIRSGKVRALAVTTAKRSSYFPDIPTMIEAGMAGYETSTWGGLLAPAHTPKAVVERLSAEVAKVLAAADVRETLSGAGIEAMSSTPQQFAAFILAERDRWAKVARAAGIQPE